MARSRFRSFYTGRSNGDAFEGPIVHHKPESLNIPQSGKYEKWTSLTFLGEKAANRRDLGKDMAAKTGEKPQLDIATDGFEVAISQYKRQWHPCSEGIAVSRIQLCEILDEKAAWVSLNLPPDPLPRRHIFWREEMSDGVMAKDSLCPGNGGLDWIEQKFRAMKIFGQNTYCKDLLEFGHNQHWDWHWKHGKPGGKSFKWMWACDAYYADLWTKIVALAADKYGFDLLPYYEYGGAAGDPKEALGPQKRAEPLDIDNKPDRKARGANYTHIWWSEGKLRVDITDPDTLEELKYILEGTILRYKDLVDKGAFVGALMRPRPGHWAISFSDKTRARFAKEVVKGACSDPEVVLREIDCSKLGVKAKYYALVHTGWKEKSDIKVTIPGAKSEVEFVAYGKTRTVKNGVLAFKTLKPLQLIAIKAK